MTRAPDPDRVPELHRRFLVRALQVLALDDTLVGVAVGGSYATGHLDAWSDLDLVLVVAESLPEVRERHAVAGRLGPLLAAFTGEHVGDPRVLICLYGPPLLHVDLKFVTLGDFEHRAEDPTVLWERNGELNSVIARTAAAFPAPDLQWIEDRFWVWVHYAAAKVRRGELLEARAFLSFIQSTVCGPLAHAAHGTRPQGLRRAESLPPDDVAALREMCVPCEPAAVRDGILAAVRHYRGLRRSLAVSGLTRREVAETESVAYLEAS